MSSNFVLLDHDRKTAHSKGREAFFSDVPLSFCPYNPISQAYLTLCWRGGWLNAHINRKRTLPDRPTLCQCELNL